MEDLCSDQKQEEESIVSRLPLSQFVSLFQYQTLPALSKMITNMNKVLYIYIYSGEQHTYVDPKTIQNNIIE